MCVLCMFTGVHDEADTMQTIAKLKHEVRLVKSDLNFKITPLQYVLYVQSKISHRPFFPLFSSDERPFSSGKRCESGVAGNDTTSQTPLPQPLHADDTECSDSAAQRVIARLLSGPAPSYPTCTCGLFKRSKSTSIHPGT